MFKARFPLIYMTTWEESRAIDVLQNICADEKLLKTKRNLITWSTTDGFCGGKNQNDPLDALGYIEKGDESAVYVLKDFHVYMDPKSKLYDYTLIRKLRDLVEIIKFSPVFKTIVIISPVTVVPIELQKDISLVDFELPKIQDMKLLLNGFIETNVGGNIHMSITEDKKEALCGAALGLTLQEAENAFARATVNDGKLDITDIATILEEKRQIIKKTGILEYINSDLNVNDIGGLENLKRWLTKRQRAWSKEAEEYGLNPPKGILITGVPGCGKSLTAKVVGEMWNMPLLRMDIGSIFSGIVGSSEENMRRAIKTAESLAPCVLWIDEIEKGFSGLSSSGDSGVSSRIFGTFLTWMQEKKASVFVIATANNISALPPEFMRKGRFDEIFFVDIPTYRERKDIFKIHLNKRYMSDEVFSEINVDEETVGTLAGMTEGFVGAEIEETVVNALFEAFFKQAPLTLSHLEMAIQNTIPLSVTQHEQILAIREWANIRAVAATAKEDLPEYDEVDTTSEATQEFAEKKIKIDRSRGGRTVEF